MVCPPQRRSGIRYLAFRRGERGHAAREHGMGLGCHQSPFRVRSHRECALARARVVKSVGFLEFTKTWKLAFHFPTLLDGRRRPHLTCVTCYLMPRFVAREFCGFSTAKDAKMITRTVERAIFVALPLCATSLRKAWTLHNSHRRCSHGGKLSSPSSSAIPAPALSAFNSPRPCDPGFIETAASRAPRPPSRGFCSMR